MLNRKESRIYGYRCWQVGKWVVKSGSSLVATIFLVMHGAGPSAECWLYFQNTSRIQSLSHHFSCYHLGPSYQCSPRVLQMGLGTSLPASTLPPLQMLYWNISASCDSSALILQRLSILLRQKSKLLLPPYLPSATSPLTTLLLTHCVPFYQSSCCALNPPVMLLSKNLRTCSFHFLVCFSVASSTTTHIPYIPYLPSLPYFPYGTYQHLTYNIFSLLFLLECKFCVRRELYPVVSNAFPSA